jgi:hypothetical protein
VTDQTPEPAACGARHRDALRDLIARVGRGRAGADIATHIASHLDAEQALAAAERAAHEEHRRQLADALGGMDPATPWDSLIRRAAQVLAGRHRAVDTAQEIEADRDRLAEQLRRAAGRLADAEARAEQAEELLSIAHQTSNTSERLRALAATERDQLAAELRNARYETEGERRRADRAEATVRDYENRIAWETTCGEHARLLDSCRAADERATRAEIDATRAEVTIARVRDAVVQWRGWNPTENAWAIRDIERALSGDPDPQPQDPPHDKEQPDTEPSPRCVCGDPIQRWTGPGEPGWIHSPGSDTTCTDPRPAVSSMTDESEAAMSFTDAVETATEEEVSGPDPDEPEEPCFHPAWETEPTVGARKCTDCGEWLDPQPKSAAPAPVVHVQVNVTPQQVADAVRRILHDDRTTLRFARR